MIRAAQPGRFRFASALRDSISGGYSLTALRNDLLAGLIVAVVALPLSMAFAIASGVPPQYGLYTVIVATPLIAFFGGSRVNVSGPTAALIVLLAPVTATYGLGGLVVTALMSGLILLGMGLGKLGRLIQFIPHPVTTGFTTGIAVLIATLQLKDFFGLTLDSDPQHYVERLAALWRGAHSVRWEDLSIGAFTLAVLLVLPKLLRRVPAPLVAVTAAAALAYLLTHSFADFGVATIGNRFTWTLADGTSGSGIPPGLPAFALPWNLPGPGGEPLGFDLAMIQDLIVPAFTIALLSAITTLLCAVVADGLAGTRHDPDSELIGQGVGNIVGPFFGGIPASGAVARTATNIRAGGRTPVAALAHAGIVFATLLGLGTLLGYLPMASLAALLLVVAWRMADLRHFVKMLRVSPRSDILVLTTCFLLTVLVNMVVSVSVGVVLAAILFMKRMSDLSEAREVRPAARPELVDLPDGVLFYEVAGPLFFGAASKAMSSLDTVSSKTRALILDLDAVPVMDVTGLVALQSALDRLAKAGVFVVIAGARAQPRQLMEKGGVRSAPGKLAYYESVQQAVEDLRAPSAPGASSESNRRHRLTMWLTKQGAPPQDGAPK